MTVIVDTSDTAAILVDLPVRPTITIDVDDGQYRFPTERPRSRCRPVR